jgi:uncharacterized protein YbcV (DUF1398 family)
MDVAIKDVLQECTEGSDRGELNFGEVVRKLIAAGIERYHADFMRSEKTYYLSDGDSKTVSNETSTSNRHTNSLSPVFNRRSATSRPERSLISVSASV